MRIRNKLSKVILVIALCSCILGATLITASATSEVDVDDILLSGEQGEEVEDIEVPDGNLTVDDIQPITAPDEPVISNFLPSIPVTNSETAILEPDGDTYLEIDVIDGVQIYTGRWTRNSESGIWEFEAFDVIMADDSLEIQITTTDLEVEQQIYDAEGNLIDTTVPQTAGPNTTIYTIILGICVAAIAFVVYNLKRKSAI